MTSRFEKAAKSVERSTYILFERLKMRAVSLCKFSHCHYFYFIVFVTEHTDTVSVVVFNSFLLRHINDNNKSK